MFFQAPDITNIIVKSLFWLRKVVSGFMVIQTLHS